MKSSRYCATIQPLLSLAMCLVLLLSIGPHRAVAQTDHGETEEWTRSAAATAVRSVDTGPVLTRLESLYRAGETRAVLDELDNLADRHDWPAPARDAAVMAFTRQLRVPTGEPGSTEVLDWLERYTPATRVAHPDHPRAIVPLFNTRAAVTGLRNERRSAAAAARARAILAERPASLAQAWADSDEVPERLGLLQALAQTDTWRAGQVAAEALRQRPIHPDMAELAGYAALRNRDTAMLAQALLEGDGASLSHLLRHAAHALPTDSRARLLFQLLAAADTPTASLAIAHLAPTLAAKKDVQRQLNSLLDDPELGVSAALALAADPPELSYPGRAPAPPVTWAAQDGFLAEWVESNPSNATDRIALGYPPPIPVDTPLPFDGFRSYAGLHARHQELAASTPWVHPHAIGTTRKGRTIWAYRLGDSDMTTPWGLPEPATLTNGGIHAREWSTPEAVTGILELIATSPGDQHVSDYLREQVNMIVIPVLNVDGFLQTQRDPTLNYLGSDPDFPGDSPRDGRMRRKNLLNADEALGTRGDHLGGVDLNRNNGPHWASNSQRSSGDPASLVYHGASPASEPEILALQSAPDLGPGERLRIYTDVHSYSQVHFWSRLGDGTRLARQTQDVLRVFSNHHRALDAGKRYHYAFSGNVPVNQGIGATDEYFLYTYRVPAWTLETEPSGGQSYHSTLPGGGADYGGAGVNVHDGFILPDSQARRVREDLARTFTTVFYRQSGPPNLQATRIIDEATGAVIFEAQWDGRDDETRTLFAQQLQSLAPGRAYRLWLAFNKPMRWLDESGNATALQGHDSPAYLDVAIELIDDADEALEVAWGDPTWLVEPGGAPDGYLRYRTDAYAIPFIVADSPDNQARLAEPLDTTLRVRTWDMTYLGLDGDPATVADWTDGHWSGFEDSFDQDTDVGGWDDTLAVRVQAAEADTPFTLSPGIASAWYDPSHSGEGFIIEMMAGQRAVMYWYTYTDSGEQDWYVGAGEVRGNRLVFPALTRTSGGAFGEAFDPEQVTRSVVGSAKFIFESCDTGEMDWHIGHRQGRQSIRRITRIAGLDCGAPGGGPVREEARYSGAWYDPDRSGEGFTLQVLSGDRALAYWFSFGPEGNRRWFYGTGEIVDGVFVFEDMRTTLGGIFGGDFDPDAVAINPWGQLTLDLGCDGGTATWTSTEPGFSDGTMDLVQLTRMDGLACAR